MELLDHLTVSFQGQQRSIELYHGDRTQLREKDDVEILVISAFPNDYIPVQGTLIGALHQSGVSVAKLAGEKAEDLRKNFSCWISKDLQGQFPGINFPRIPCFEPFKPVSQSVFLP